MSILLFLLAFPGLTVIATVLWLRAQRRYQSLVQLMASYPDPTVDDVIDQGFLGTYRRTSAATSQMDQVARSGSLGPDAQRLEAIQRRWFYVVGLSIPVGMGLTVFISWAISTLANATDSTTDALSVALVLVSSFAAIGVVSARSAIVLARNPRTRSTAALYLVGLVILGIGAAFLLTRLFG